MKKFVLCMIYLLITCNVSAVEKDDTQGAVAEITALLQQWPKDFNERKVAEVCSLFGPDLVASYPGTIDRNYEQMCRHLSETLTSKKTIYRYAAPNIEDIKVDGNLATVRLIWTLTVLDKDQKFVQKIEEKGLDVFSRQKDGKWKIAVSFAYPLSDHNE